MERHSVTLHLRTLQALAEIAVDKNSTVVFPVPLMTTIQELGAFMAREPAVIDGRASRERLRDGAPDPLAVEAVVSALVAHPGGQEEEQTPA